MVKLSPFRIPLAPLNVMDYGTHADGVTNDADHFETAMDAAVAAGKRLWVPPGVYYFTTHLTPPNNLYMFGPGASARLIRYDDDSMSTPILFYIVSTSNVSLHRMALEGSTATANTSALLVKVGTSANPTLDALSFDKCYYGLKADSQCAGTNTGLQVLDCTAGADCQNPVYTSNTTGAYFRAPNFYAATYATNLATPHHFYIAGACDDITIDDAVLINGHAYSIQVYPSAAGNVTFNNLTLTNVTNGVAVYANNNPVTIDGFTGTSNRMGTDAPWFTFQSGATNVTVKNFTITGDPAAADYLIYVNAAGTGNLFQDGTITSSAYLGNTPPGCLLQNGGSLPTYSNVTVS